LREQRERTARDPHSSERHAPKRASRVGTRPNHNHYRRPDMADTTPDCTPDTDIPDRYIVLRDGVTCEPLKGSRIIEISDELEGDDIAAAIKARCQEGDAEAGKGITVLYTAHGYEPGLADGQTAPPLSGAIAVTAAAPTPNGVIVGERRTVVIEFLGHKGALSDDEMDVADMLERASGEDLLADVKTTVVEPLDDPTLARLAKEARGESDFFDLAEDGTPLDPFDD
jgi:hypothetical protein